MPTSALWSLIVSLILLALGLSLKLANTSHLLKLADKEIDSFIKQITSLKEKHEEAISGLSQLHRTEVKKVLTAYENSMNKLIDQMEHYAPPSRGLSELGRLNRKPISLADLGRKQL